MLTQRMSLAAVPWVGTTYAPRVAVTIDGRAVGALAVPRFRVGGRHGLHVALTTVPRLRRTGPPVPIRPGIRIVVHGLTAPMLDRAAISLLAVGQRPGTTRLTETAIGVATTDAAGRFTKRVRAPRRSGTYVVVARYRGRRRNTLPDSNCDLRFEVRPRR